MATHGVAKRKRPRGPASDEEQEPNRLDSKKQPKGGGRGGKKKVVENDDEDDDEDNDDGDAETDNDDDYDNRSQKRRMMLFERKLKAMKKQKKSSSESSTIKFKKKIKSQEETLISSLQEQRTKIKSDALSFSKTITTLLHNASSSFFPGLSTESTINLPDFIQNNQLRASQVSIAVLSARLLTSAQSLQATLAKIADHDLVLGEGWEQDGDLSIGALYQGQQAALVKLTDMVSMGRGGSASTKEEIGEVQWKRTVKRSTKGISKLLKDLPVPTIDEVRMQQLITSEH